MGIIDRVDERTNTKKDPSKGEVDLEAGPSNIFSDIHSIGPSHHIGHINQGCYKNREGILYFIVGEGCIKGVVRIQKLRQHPTICCQQNPHHRENEA